MLQDAVFLGQTFDNANLRNYKVVLPSFILFCATGEDQMAVPITAYLYLNT